MLLNKKHVWGRETFYKLRASEVPAGTVNLIPLIASDTTI